MMPTCASFDALNDVIRGDISGALPCCDWTEDRQGLVRAPKASAALRPSVVRWLLSALLCLPVAAVVLLAGAGGAPGAWTGPSALAGGLLLVVAAVLLAWLARRGTDHPDDTL